MFCLYFPIRKIKGIFFQILKFFKNDQIQGHNSFEMTITRGRTPRMTYTTFVNILLSVMFLITMVLSFMLLNNEQCNCSGQASIYKYDHLARTRRKPISTRHQLAVLVPFRDRFEELLEFVPYIHRFLNHQKISHNIFILNQVDKYRFNRASLINAGFLQTKDNHDYIAMHDVDLLPLNMNLSYAYPDQPMHLAAPNLHPRYHYEKFIGGILLMKREHFQKVNGLSNRYWGWGLEDDEFYVRIKDAKLNVTRPQNIKTGKEDTFRHIHGKERQRDTTKCYNQREVTRRRDRQTGLRTVQYEVMSHKNMEIDGAPLIIINIQLYCNHTATPWCDCTAKESINSKSSPKT